MTVLGDRWARLSVIGETTKVKREEFPGGYEEINIHQWQLKCQCGNVIEVDKKGFRKKDYKDCGCKVSENDGVHVITSWSVPLFILLKVRKYAHDHKVSVSYAVTHFLSKGMEAEEREHQGVAVLASVEAVEEDSDED